MATETRMLACRICNAVTPHEVEKTSHILHLLLTVFTAGLWLPIWILLGLIRSLSSKGRCQQCIVMLNMYDQKLRR